MFTGSSVALVTPFTQNNEIDIEQLTQLIEWHIKSGTQAIVLAGTTGESPNLSTQEKVELALTGVRVAAGRVPIIMGNGSNSTHNTIELTKALNGTGIQGFLTVTPYYNKPTQAGLLQHFSAVAASTELPILLYNVPGRTGTDLSVETTCQLAKIANIVGIKDATAELDRVDTLRAGCGADFRLYSGDDGSGLSFCERGGNGVISVTANLSPKAMSKVYQLLAQNNIEQAKQLDDKLRGLHQALFIEANPIPIKWAMYKQELLNNPALRLPLTPLTQDAQATVCGVMQDCDLLSQEY